jgi:hypothetical protein
MTIYVVLRLQCAQSLYRKKAMVIIVFVRLESFVRTAARILLFPVSGQAITAKTDGEIASKTLLFNCHATDVCYTAQQGIFTNFG